ncbi:hypothetical protein HDU93_005007 [Gonapodya sp. JEL0774]|nr:hypothetical protein HDU93_005007 [Gonapodya sp. JEL0774]
MPAGPKRLRVEYWDRVKHLLLKEGGYPATLDEFVVLLCSKVEVIENAALQYVLVLKYLASDGHTVLEMTDDEDLRAMYSSNAETCVVFVDLREVTIENQHKLWTHDKLNRVRGSSSASSTPLPYSSPSDWEGLSSHVPSAVERIMLNGRFSSHSLTLPESRTSRPPSAELLTLDEKYFLAGLSNRHHRSSSGNAALGIQSNPTSRNSTIEYKDRGQTARQSHTPPSTPVLTEPPPRTHSRTFGLVSLRDQHGSNSTGPPNNSISSSMMTDRESDAERFQTSAVPPQAKGSIKKTVSTGIINRPLITTNTNSGSLTAVSNTLTDADSSSSSNSLSRSTSAPSTRFSVGSTTLATRSVRSVVTSAADHDLASSVHSTPPLSPLPSSELRRSTSSSLSKSLGEPLTKVETADLMGVLGDEGWGTQRSWGYKQTILFDNINLFQASIPRLPIKLERLHFHDFRTNLLDPISGTSPEGTDWAYVAPPSDLVSSEPKTQGGSPVEYAALHVVKSRGSTVSEECLKRVIIWLGARMEVGSEWGPPGAASPRISRQNSPSRPGSRSRSRSRASAPGYRLQRPLSAISPGLGFVFEEREGKSKESLADSGPLPDGPGNPSKVTDSSTRARRKSMTELVSALLAGDNGKGGWRSDHTRSSRGSDTERAQERVNR